MEKQVTNQKLKHKQQTGKDKLKAFCKQTPTQGE